MSSELGVYGDNYIPGLDTYANTRIESIPIHPDYISMMNVDLKIGDLVRAYFLGTDDIYQVIEVTDNLLIIS